MRGVIKWQERLLKNIEYYILEGEKKEGAGSCSEN